MKVNRLEAVANAELVAQLNPNSPALRPYRRAASQLAKYGITPDDYERLMLAQDCRCAICGYQCATGRLLAVDHDHITGRVRGLLCSKCNTGIGLLGDTVEMLRKAIDYVEAGQ